MRYLLIAAMTLFLTCTTSRAELVTVQSAAGPVTLSSEIASRMVSLISDVVAMGFRGRVNCHARGGHVRNSRHYSGNACDFAQRGWGRTHAVMYRAGDAIARAGLRDGCSFRDCGHVDDGGRARSAYASRQIERTYTYAPVRVASRQNERVRDSRRRAAPEELTWKIRVASLQRGESRD